MVLYNKLDVSKFHFMTPYRINKDTYRSNIVYELNLSPCIQSSNFNLFTFTNNELTLQTREGQFYEFLNTMKEHLINKSISQDIFKTKGKNVNCNIDITKFHYDSCTSINSCYNCNEDDDNCIFENRLYSTFDNSTESGSSYLHATIGFHFYYLQYNKTTDTITLKMDISCMSLQYERDKLCNAFEKAE